ncbi:MAG: phosphoglycerate mutase family protein [Symbiobacteriaceae bacterium]|jgi:broad specificity phosphatase PhoE|nr:phosphoglycerate mutase family protein [Symbiobacteriaceae bacterium]
MIRHGETEWNHLRRIVGQGNPTLNETGRRQAAATAEWLAGLKLEIIYTSDLARARETAEIVAGVMPGADIRSDRRLREKDAGVATGMPWEEARDGFPEYHEAMRRDPLNTRPEGGESVADQVARVVEALDEYGARHPGQAVGVVTHGGVIRCALMRAMNLTMAQINQLDPDNCSLTVIEWGEQMMVRTLNSLPDPRRHHRG